MRMMALYHRTLHLPLVLLWYLWSARIRVSPVGNENRSEKGIILSAQSVEAARTDGRKGPTTIIGATRL
uniref:Putative secreted protein n=1 Tax=Anopheles marajoara TaxID=58244 RepID=A0A2M4CEX6_9DIPT